MRSLLVFLISLFALCSIKAETTKSAYQEWCRKAYSAVKKGKPQEIIEKIKSSPILESTLGEFYRVNHHGESYFAMLSRIDATSNKISVRAFKETDSNKFGSPKTLQLERSDLSPMANSSTNQFMQKFSFIARSIELSFKIYELVRFRNEKGDMVSGTFLQQKGNKTKVLEFGKDKFSIVPADKVYKSWGYEPISIKKESLSLPSRFNGPFSKRDAIGQTFFHLVHRLSSMEAILNQKLYQASKFDVLTKLRLIFIGNLISSYFDFNNKFTTPKIHIEALKQARQIEPEANPSSIGLSIKHCLGVCRSSNTIASIVLKELGIQHKVYLSPGTPQNRRRHLWIEIPLNNKIYIFDTTSKLKFLPLESLNSSDYNLRHYLNPEKTEFLPGWET
ncbi:MAG: hypothetical protein AB8E15_07290 [Bdellovibrionales bacterium]